MDNQNINIYDYNKKMIIESVEIHPDDISSLEGSIIELTDAGVGMIREIIVEENNTYNWVLLLTDDKEQVYYLELSEYGSIIELKKDGPQGEALITVVCGFEEPVPPDSDSVG